jgi:hypothetical protein
MEDVLDVYHRPYEAKYPAVCLDEASSSSQRFALICRPRPDKYADSCFVAKSLLRRVAKDSEYKRNGTANIFMMFEPPAQVPPGNLPTPSAIK